MLKSYYQLYTQSYPPSTGITNMTKVQPWAWVVLTASFSSMFFNSSFFAVGVIHVALLEKYPDVDVTTIAWIGSVFSCMFALSGFLGSFIINISNVRSCVMLSGLLALVGFATSSIVTDHRLLFLTYGIIAGSGPAMSMAGSLVVIGYYFGPKTSMATGIATSGCALCTFIFPPLTQYCVDTYGLGGAFLILGGLGFQSAVCGALMRPTKYEIRSKKTCNCLCIRRDRSCDKRDINCDNGRDICNNYSDKNCDINRDKSYDIIRVKSCDINLDKNCDNDTVILKRTSSQPQMLACFLKRNVILFTSPSFWLLLICSFSFHVALSCVYLYLPDYLIHQGSSHQEAAFVLAITGVTGILSRILLGFLASSVDASLVLGSTLGIMGIITFFIKFMKTLGSKITFTTLLGFYTGGSWALQYTLLVEIVGLYQQSTAYGIMMHVSGIGYMVGPPFAEMMVVWFQDYYWAFVFSAVSFLIAALSGLAIKAVLGPHSIASTIAEIEMTEKEELFIEYNEQMKKDIIIVANEETNEQSILICDKTQANKNMV